MARAKTDTWNDWKTLPNDGDLIVVKIDGKLDYGQYFDDGNVQFDDFVLTPDKRGDSVWKLKETKQNQTKPKQTNKNEVKTTSTVFIPVELFYSRFDDLIKGYAVKSSMKGDGKLIAVDVELVQVVEK